MTTSPASLAPSSSSERSDSTKPRPSSTEVHRGKPSHEHGLWPREHGAYAQIALPLVSALAVGRPGALGFVLAGSAFAGFLAHEPALVLAGRRGPRALAALGDAARRRLTSLAFLGALAVPAAVAAGSSTWLAAALALAPLVLAVALAVAKREKTLRGELTVAGALSATSLPVATASGVSLEHAAALALAWWTTFALGTLAVHALLRRHTRQNATLAHTTLVLAGAVVLASTFGASMGAPWLLGLAPLALVAAFHARFATPRDLRRVGWSMVAAHVVMLVFVAATFGAS